MKKWIKITVAGVAVIYAVVLGVPKGIKLYNYIKEERAITSSYETFILENKSFYENSYFNDVDISGLSMEEAYKAVTDDFEKNVITIKTPFEEEENFSYKDLNAEYNDLLSELQTAFYSQTLTKEEYVNGAERKDYEHSMAECVDFSKVDLSGLAIYDLSTRIYSKDAYISVDSASGTILVTKEVYGNVIKEGRLEEKLKAAVLAHDNTITLDYTDYEMPSVLSTDPELEATKNYYEILLNKTLYLNVCGVKITLTPSQTLGLYDFVSGDEANDAAIYDYVRSLKGQYDTYGSYRDFLTSTGEITTITNGNYGWLIDLDATAEAIKTACLSENSEVSVDACYTVIGQRAANDEISNTYVEISLRDQKIWMYIGGELVVYDDVTTGEVNDPESVTNCGIFKLTYKKSDVVLRGPTWEDPVSYWMPYDGANGMHDATWRSYEEFGGDNRNGNGSHGCVNLRLETATIIYNNIQMDTPIIIW